MFVTLPCPVMAWMPEMYGSSMCCAAGFYLLYAKMEEEHGLARHAMEVYDRATQAVQAEEQYEVWSQYQYCICEALGIGTVM